MLNTMERFLLKIFCPDTIFLVFNAKDVILPRTKQLLATMLTFLKALILPVFNEQRTSGGQLLYNTVEYKEILPC
jgi:hypothetical protein